MRATHQVLRLSEEQLSGGVLDDAAVAVIARGCTQLQELELVQVSTWVQSTDNASLIGLAEWIFLHHIGSCSFCYTHFCTQA